MTSVPGAGRKVPPARLCRDRLGGAEELSRPPGPPNRRVSSFPCNEQKQQRCSSLRCSGAPEPRSQDQPAGPWGSIGSVLSSRRWTPGSRESRVSQVNRSRAGLSRDLPVQPGGHEAPSLRRGQAEHGVTERGSHAEGKTREDRAQLERAPASALSGTESALERVNSGEVRGEQRPCVLGAGLTGWEKADAFCAFSPQFLIIVTDFGLVPRARVPRVRERCPSLCAL